MNSNLIKRGERLESLLTNNYQILQNSKKYCFTSDSVLLSNFVTAKKNDKVLEFCSGSGVISILLYARCAPREIHLIELQKYMADMSKRTIKINNLEGKLFVHNSKVQNRTKLFEKASFDVVMANPPYKKISGSELNKKTAIALSRHEIKLTLRELFDAASAMLKFGGKFFLVHEASRLAEIVNLSSQNKMELKRLQLVQNKTNTPPKLILAEIVKGAKSGLKILPNIMLNGKFAEET